MIISKIVCTMNIILITMLFIVMLALHFLIIKLWNFQCSEILVESKFYYPMWIYKFSQFSWGWEHRLGFFCQAISKEAKGYCACGTSCLSITMFHLSARTRVPVLRFSLWKAESEAVIVEKVSYTWRSSLAARL